MYLILSTFCNHVPFPCITVKYKAEDINNWFNNITLQNAIYNFLSLLPVFKGFSSELRGEGGHEAHESILTYILSLASSLIRKTDLHYRYLFFLNLMLKYVFIAKAVFNIYFYYKNKLYFK